MKKITELKDPNLAVIDSLTDEQRHEWYLRIKMSLPELKKTRNTAELERAIASYEQRHKIV